MLKYFYKTFLVSILCGSLLLLDFSYKGLTVSTVQAAQSETVKTEGIKDSDLMGTLTMAVVGTLAMRLYTYKMTTDVMLAAGGGAAFIAGEILAFLKLKKVMKDMETKITRDDKGNIDQKQIDTLVKLKESYEEAKKTANTKKTLQMTAAAAFAAAGVLAYTSTMAEVTGLTTCTTGITTALTALNTMKATCASLTAGTYTASEGARCYAEVTACETPILAFQPVLQAHEMKRQAMSPSMAALTTDTTENSTLSAQATAMGTTCTGTYGLAGAGAGPACSPLFPVEMMNSSGGAGLLMAMNNSILAPSAPKVVATPKNTLNLKKYFENAMNIMFPTANAELFSAMGIASSAAISFLMYTNKAIGPMIDIYMLTPKNRAIVWGVLAGLTFAATSATSNQISKIEANIQKIDAIINSMRSFQNGVAQTKTPSVQNQTIDKDIANNRKLNLNDLEKQEIDLKANGGGNLPCVNGESADKCPAFSDQLKNQADFNTMSTDVQATMSDVGKVVDGINGTSKISASTLSAANSVSARMNALQSELARKRKEAQEKLRAAGNNFDSSKEASKLDGNIKSAVENQLKKSNMSASEMLASFGGGKGFGSGSGSGSGAVATDASKNAKDAKNAGKKGAAVAIPVVAIPAASMPRMDDKSLSDGMKNGEENADAAALAASAEGKAGETMDDYDLKNDINKEKDSSIFDLISNRYQKSGYPRLFKRIK